MSITITGTNFDLGDSIKNTIQHQINELFDHYGLVAKQVHVTFKKNGHGIFTSHIDAIIKEGSFRIANNADAGDAISAFELAIKNVKHSLVKCKSKLSDIKKRNATKTTEAIKSIIEVDQIAVENEQNISYPEQKINILSEKSIHLEEMDANEAIILMNLANLPAYPFIDTKTKQTCFIYNRKDGNVSLIVLK